MEKHVKMVKDALKRKSGGGGGVSLANLFRFPGSLHPLLSLPTIITRSLSTFYLGESRGLLVLPSTHHTPILLLQCEEAVVSNQMDMSVNTYWK